MPLARRDAAYGAVVLPLLFFLAGISIAYAASVNTLQAITTACVCCFGATALILSYFRYLRDSSPPRHHLLLEAHEQVARLIDAGCDMLMPCEEHHETVRLLICMEGGNAVIKKETWRGVWHYYTISPDGEMKREIWGVSGELTPADRQWLNSPLTSARLEGLVTAFRSTYSPRRRAPVTP